MKKATIIAAAIFLLAACNNEKKTDSGASMAISDLAIENLKGSISSYNETPYKTDSAGKIGEMDSCCISVNDYDENGYSTNYTSKDSKGTVKETAVFARHPNGLWKGASNTKDGKPSGSFNTQLDE